MHKARTIDSSNKRVNLASKHAGLTFYEVTLYNEMEGLKRMAIPLGRYRVREYWKKGRA